MCMSICVSCALFLSYFQFRLLLLCLPFLFSKDREKRHEWNWVCVEVGKIWAELEGGNCYQNILNEKNLN